MAHALRTGTAWDKRTEDYAYTRGLDKPGWAWEFLRRNMVFQRAANLAQGSKHVTFKQVSGTRLYEADVNDNAALSWGLCVFPDAQKSALDADIFWHPQAISSHLRLLLSPFAGQSENAFALEDFQCRRAVLRQNYHEQLVLQHGSDSIRLTACGRSLLDTRSNVTFEIDGFAKTHASVAVLQLLSRFREAPPTKPQSHKRYNSKWHDYLVALDGHLAGGSYRDIAEVLYGADRVKSVWTDETRHLKDRTRRAVECGVALMNGGYRDLL